MNGFSEVTSRDAWASFVEKSQGSFLQSWEWGDFQQKTGAVVWRMGLYENGLLVSIALVVRRDVSKGKFWLYVSGGILGAVKEMSAFLVAWSREQGAIFLRSDVLADTNTLGDGWVKSSFEVQPRDTMILDLRRGEEDLLHGMHQKTRYNVRLAMKRGVTVEFSQKVEDVELFLQLVHEARGDFHYHPDAYYREMVSTGFCTMAIARYQGQVLAVYMLVIYGERATYVHGVSSLAHKSVMAPALVYWELIRYAKAHGALSFDFYGVAPEDASPDHGWAGITKMKLGFGGKRVHYAGAYDYPLSRLWYYLYIGIKRWKNAL